MATVTNYKQLEKLTQLYNRLKELDAEIIAIEKIAISINEHKTSIVMSLSVTKESIGEQAIVKEEPEDIYRSLSSMYTFSFLRQPEREEKPNPNVISHNQTVCDSQALRILSVLVINKSEERELLVKQIKSLDF